MEYVMSDGIKSDITTVNESTDLVQKVPDNLNNYTNGLIVTLVKNFTANGENNINIKEEGSQSLPSNECNENKLQQDGQTHNKESVNHEEILMETEVDKAENDVLPGNEVPDDDNDDEEEDDKLSLSSSDDDDDDDFLMHLKDQVEADSGSDAENNNPKNNHKSYSKKQNDPEEIFPTKDVSEIIAADVADLKLVGRFKHSVKESNIIVIESVDGMPGLNLETILFRKDGKAFGEISDVIGPVVRPFYLVKFSTGDEITSKQIQEGEEFFYIPNHAQYTKFIFAEELNRNRGTDASWIGDEEAPDEIKEYSDDEEEKRSKKKTTNQKADSPTTSWPPKKKIIVPKRQKKAQQNLQQSQGPSDQQWPPGGQACSSFFPSFTNGPVSQMPMGNSYGPMGGQPGHMGGQQGFVGGPYGPMAGPQDFMGRPQGPTNGNMMYPPNPSYPHQPGQPFNDAPFMASHGAPRGGPYMARGPHNQGFFYGPQNQGYFGQPRFHGPQDYNSYHGQPDPRHPRPPFGWY